MSSAWGNVFATVPQRNVYAVTALADLKNLTPPTGDATVSVDYRNAIGDGFGDLYSWNAGDVRADNGTTIIQPNSAPAAGRWNAAALGLAFALGAGTVAAPALTFGGDASSGFYRPAANQIGVSISGVQKALFSATGIVASGAKILINGGAIPRVDFAPSSGNTRTGSLTQQGDSLIFASDLANLMALNLSTGNVSGVPTFTALTSVVTPLVAVSDNGTLIAQADALSGRFKFGTGVSGDSALRFNPIGGTAGGLDTQSFSMDVVTWGSSATPHALLIQNNGGKTLFGSGGVFTSIIDSGTTGSLFLKTNNGNPGLRVDNVASSVNFTVAQGAPTGFRPAFGVLGSDTNIGLIIASAGTGGIDFFTAGSNTSLAIGATQQFAILHTATTSRWITVTGSNGGQPILGATASAGVAIVGTATNDNAATGQYGEYVSSTIATGASVALTTAVSANITSITLGAGDWDVSGCICFTFGATTSYTNLVGGASATSATLGNQETTFDYETPATVPTAGKDMSWVIPEQRFSLNGSTTIFLVVQGTFTVSTLKAYGIIRARRVR